MFPRTQPMLGFQWCTHCASELLWLVLHGSPEIVVLAIILGFAMLDLCVHVSVVCKYSGPVYTRRNTSYVTRSSLNIKMLKEGKHATGRVCHWSLRTTDPHPSLWWFVAHQGLYNPHTYLLVCGCGSSLFDTDKPNWHSFHNCVKPQCSWLHLWMPSIVEGASLFYCLLNRKVLTGAVFFI